MLTENEINQVKDFLNRAQNPLFFFDNDADGLSSFLLLRRYINRGIGVAIKSFPELNENYLRKVTEFNPDFIFILDKPLVSEKFLNEVEEHNIPIIWIDHHPVQQPIKKNIFYFNPLKSNNPSNEPTSYWCYKIVQSKSDMWIATIGCIGDWFLPEFLKEFSSQYPDLLGNVKTAAQALYETRFGKIVTMLSFALKDKTSNIVRAIKFLIQAKSPYELLEENEKTKSIYIRFRQIDRKYSKLIEKAKKLKHGKLLFFKYSGDLSISGEISNELFYNFPNRVVIVAFIKGDEAKLSLRAGINIRDISLKAMEGLNARGGGHENACAATIPLADLEEFVKRIKEML